MLNISLTYLRGLQDSQLKEEDAYGLIRMDD